MSFWKLGALESSWNRIWEPGKKEVRILLVPVSVILQLLSLLHFSNGSHPWAVWPRVVHTVLFHLWFYEQPTFKAEGRDE